MGGGGMPGAGPSIAAPSAGNPSQANALSSPFGGMSPDMAGSMLQKLLSGGMGGASAPAGAPVTVTPQVNPANVAASGSGLIQQLLAQLGMAGGI